MTRSRCWIELERHGERSFFANVHPEDDYGPIFVSVERHTAELAEAEARMWIEFNGGDVSQVLA